MSGPCLKEAARQVAAMIDARTLEEVFGLRLFEVYEAGKNLEQLEIFRGLIVNHIKTASW